MPRDIASPAERRGGLAFYFLSRKDGDFVTDVERVLHFGGPMVSSVPDLVTQVMKRARVTWPDQIKRLTIAGHGNPYGFRIGRDWVSEESLPRHAVVLSLLNAFWAPRAHVVLTHCQIGQNRRLLSALSKVWGGKVAVEAGTADQMSAVPWLIGDNVVCLMDSCTTE